MTTVLDPIAAAIAEVERRCKDIDDRIHALQDEHARLEHAAETLRMLTQPTEDPGASTQEHGHAGGGVDRARVVVDGPARPQGDVGGVQADSGPPAERGTSREETRAAIIAFLRVREPRTAKELTEVTKRSTAGQIAAAMAYQGVLVRRNYPSDTGIGQAYYYARTEDAFTEAFESQFELDDRSAPTTPAPVPAPPARREHDEPPLIKSGMAAARPGKVGVFAVRMASAPLRPTESK